MSKHKIGDEIKVISVEIQDDMSFKIECNKYNIIGINDDYICYDDYHFNTAHIGKGKSYLSNKLDTVSICKNTDRTMIELFGRFNCKIKTQMGNKAVENKINREFNKWIAEKVGRYGKALKINIKFDAATDNEVTA